MRTAIDAENATKGLRHQFREFHSSTGKRRRDMAAVMLGTAAGLLGWIKGGGRIPRYETTENLTRFCRTCMDEAIDALHPDDSWLLRDKR